MAMFSMLAAGLFIKLIAIIWVLCAVVLILVVLIQKGKGGGLSGIFGSGMAGSLLGADTKKPMTWFTIGLVGIFLFLAVLLARLYRPTVSSTPEEAPVGQTATTEDTAPAGNEADNTSDVNLM
jgi:preprotein translocase subunit SecG